MIAYLEGTLLQKEKEYFILLVQSIGYKVFVPEHLLNSCVPGEQKKVWIHHHIREQSSDLYGFEERIDIDFFNLLLGVNGIGPKSALGVMNTSTTEVLIHSIANNDLTHLTKVAGIGKKSAEKILLELRDKVESTIPVNSASSSKTSDALQGLVSLGYSEKEAREAIKNFDPELSTEELITQALRALHN